MNYFEILENSHEQAHLQKLLVEGATVENAYYFWKNNLLERCLRLFKIENLPDTIPYKEIETRLLLFGVCGFTEASERELIAVTPNLYGVTYYFDEFTDFTFTTAKGITNKMRCKIGVNGEIINNNSLRQSIYHLIHRYALFLAHTEVSFITSLVNSRDDLGAVVKDSQSKSSVQEYYKQKYNGVPCSIFDGNFVGGVEFRGMGQKPTTDIKTLWDTRKEILHNFYEDIGIKSHNESKRANLTIEEVNANDSLILFNIDDMLAERQKGIERVNKLFGTNMIYSKNEIIDYKGVETDENNRTLSDNETV